MRAAKQPIQRPWGAKLLILDAGHRIWHRDRSELPGLMRPGDLVVANDAATLPASLLGQHDPTGLDIEVRLAARDSPSVNAVSKFSAIVFGSGDFRTRTEHRTWPPALETGDRLTLGPLRATILKVLSHPRFVFLKFDGTPAQIWEGLARHGRPIQYSHVSTPLSLWDVWTPIAGPPVAFEPPSAGFVLDWQTLSLIRAANAEFATLTHAAGISSSGDPALDILLPLDEAYWISESTANAVAKTKVRGGRVIAIGTTVVRALEDAAAANGVVRSGPGLATKRIGPATRLRVVDALVSGTHEPGTSHYELLRAFTDDESLAEVDRELELGNYTTHEFGDSVFIERSARSAHLGSIAKPNIESPAATTRYCMPSSS